MSAKMSAKMSAEMSTTASSAAPPTKRDTIRTSTIAKIVRTIITTSLTFSRINRRFRARTPLPYPPLPKQSRHNRAIITPILPNVVPMPSGTNLSSTSLTAHAPSRPVSPLAPAV